MASERKAKLGGSSMKYSIGVGKCSIAVQGVDMQCPLCKVMVRSGQTHECEQLRPLTAREKGGKET